MLENVVPFSHGVFSRFSLHSRKVEFPLLSLDVDRMNLILADQAIQTSDLLSIQTVRVSARYGTE